MKGNKIQNFVIILLVVAAVYQTGGLWLEDTSHSFFYTLLSVFQSRSSVMEDLLPLEPEKIVIGYGNKRYSVEYPGENTDAVLNSANNAIRELLEKGSYTTVEGFDWNEGLNNRSLILKYPFLVSSTEFAKGFGNDGVKIAAQMESFHTVILLPGRGASDQSTAYFINNDTRETIALSSESSQVFQTLYARIAEVESSEGLVYISTKQNGLNLFRDDVFVPQWVGGSYYQYKAVSLINPYTLSEGTVDREKLETSLEYFFSNFASKTLDIDENTGVYTYSNNTTVVKYYPYGVLEYYNYDYNEANEEQTLASAYTVCMEFLEGDTQLKIPYYLADVELRSEGLTFYFDYYYENYPVIFSDTLRDAMQITHSIEVIVQDNAIKKYKKVVCEFDESQETMAEMNVDFLTALNRVIAEHVPQGSAVTQVDDMKLYYIYDGENPTYLSWVTNLEGNVYISSTRNTE